jgi:hypothetical protein
VEGGGKGVTSVPGLTAAYHQCRTIPSYTMFNDLAHSNLLYLNYSLHVPFLQLVPVMSGAKVAWAASAQHAV